MKRAIIDIGSNSIHLTLYDVDGSDFKVLFKEKLMSGLAGYIEDEILTAEGIECACDGIRYFQELLDVLHIDHTAAFATASLRNIANTGEAVAAIQQSCGLPISILSENEEAMLGYLGATREHDTDNGAFLDIGGASTEIVTIRDDVPVRSISYHFGSLSLYKKCVKRIMPGKTGLCMMEGMIDQELREKQFPFDRESPLICVGGTARTILKMARKTFRLPKECKTVTAEQVSTILSILEKKDRKAIDLILKVAPDRIHTIVPGVMIADKMIHLFQAEEILVSKYGVREGYLCQNIIPAKSIGTVIPRTGN